MKGEEEERGTDSSRPVRPRWGEDDKGRDCLYLGRDGLPCGHPGRGGRPSTVSTQYWSMRQILLSYLNKLRLKTEIKIKIKIKKEDRKERIKKVVLERPTRGGSRIARPGALLMRSNRFGLTQLFYHRSPTGTLFPLGALCLGWRRRVA